jgi:hypothetical protein
LQPAQGIVASAFKLSGAGARLPYARSEKLDMAFLFQCTGRF